MADNCDKMHAHRLSTPDRAYATLYKQIECVHLPSVQMPLKDYPSPSPYPNPGKTLYHGCQAAPHLGPRLPLVLPCHLYLRRRHYLRTSLLARRLRLLTGWPLTCAILTGSLGSQNYI